MRLDYLVPNHQPQFAGSIPDNYHRYLVPILFQSFAVSIAAKVRALNPRRVLELACGTGVVTRELADVLHLDTQIVATDFSPDMLAIARQNLSGSRPIDWQVADACSLPFEDKSFDVITCQFGVMMVPDKLAALREAFRVLEPGGQLIYNAWGDIASNPFFGVIEETLAELFPHEEKPFMPTPMSMADPNLHRQLLLEAGFSSIEVGDENHRSGPYDPASLAAGFAYGTPLGAYLSGQGYDLNLVHSQLTTGFTSALGDPLFVGKTAIFSCAVRG